VKEVSEMRGGIIAVILIAMVLILVIPTACAGPKFELSSLEITPSEVATGQQATVGADLVNLKDVEATYTIQLKVDGEVVDTKEVTIDAGAKERVSFSYSTETLGTYEVEINGLAGTLEVVNPPEFQVSALETSPAEIVAGESFDISADIENLGEVEGEYTATLTVDGNVMDTTNITLDAGATEKVSFTSSLASAGIHTIELGDLTTTVTALKPAQLEVSSLEVTPVLTLPGKETTVESDVTNMGEVEGSGTITLKVNDVEIDTRTVTLTGGASDKTSFNVIRDLAGIYEISVDGQSASLTIADVETYENSMYHYSFSYPTGWQVDESDAPEMVRVTQPGIATLHTLTGSLAAGTSLDDFYAIFVGISKSNFPDLQELYRSEIIEDGVVVAYDVVFTYTDGGIKSKMRAFLSTKGGYGFSAWAEASESSYQQNESLLEACLKSFKPPEVAVGQYTNTTHGFSITLPTNWDGLVTGERTPLLIIKNPVGESLIYVYIYVSRIFEETIAKDYALDVADIWSEEPGYKIVSQSDVNLGEDTQGYEVVFTYNENGFAIKRKVVSVIRGTQAFIVIPYTLTSTYDSKRSTIEQLTNSFTLVEPRPFGVSRQTSYFRWQGEIVTLDPALAEGGGGGIIGAIFSGLVKLDKDLKVVPDIAEKWEISEDGKVYTFYLRKNSKFHDGKQVTAHDFKYSWERACDPETDSRKALLFLGDIVGAKEMLAGESTELSGVVVIDDLTLEVTIDGPKPYFLDKLAYCTAAVVDKANVARGMNWTDKPNGTGAFKLKEWKKDELLILERNTDYYLEPARLENIVFQIFAGQPMMMYEQGEIDTTGVYIDDLDRVLDPENPLNKELMTGTSIDISYLGFNVNMPPFDDPKVRRAFAMALDMDKILEVSLKGNAERAGGFLPPGIPGYNDELEPLPFVPEQAKQLIAESKYGSVNNLPPIVFYTLYALGPAEEAMIGMWQQNLGVKVEVEIIEELEEWYERSRRREFQLFSGGWNADYIDPQNFLEVLFHSQSEENRFAYSNPEVDTALEEAAVERDEETRLKMYQDIEKMILTDLPAVPFYQSWKSHVLVKPYIEGYYLAPIGINIWQDISIKPH